MCIMVSQIGSIHFTGKLFVLYLQDTWTSKVRENGL